MVNKDIVNNTYPMDRINKKLEAMIGAKVSTTLDLTKKCHQLVLYPDSKSITAFSSPDFLFQ